MIMKIPPSYFLYLILAIVFGILLSVGVNWMTYEPQPLQVPLTQYQPAQAPAPAIPTVVPALTKQKDPFAPAPAPVIVTTEPLPTITPTEVPEVPNNLPKCSSGAQNVVIFSSSNLPMLMVMATGVFFFFMSISRSGGSGLLTAILMIITGIAIFWVAGPILSSITNVLPCVP